MRQIDTEDRSSMRNDMRNETSPIAITPSQWKARQRMLKRRGRFKSADLPEMLETLTKRSLVKLDKIIKMPLDAGNGQLIRSIVTSCGIAVNAQLRADEQRLRAKSTGDALQRLLKIIEKEKLLIGQSDGKTTDNKHQEKIEHELVHVTETPSLDQNHIERIEENSATEPDND